LEAEVSTAAQLCSCVSSTVSTDPLASLQVQVAALSVEVHRTMALTPSFAIEL